MTISPDDVARRPGARYQALAAAIADAVAAGRLLPGARLPPQRELALALGVTVGTVGRAYELAATQGLVRGEVGRGTFVSLPEPERQRLRIRSHETVDGVIDLTINRPAPSGLEADLVAESAALAASGAGWLGYAPGAGLPAHRAALASWLQGQGVPASAERVLVSAGAHGGIFVALMVLTRPGDTVLVEQLSYPGLADMARALHLRAEPVAQDRQGLLPDALAEACRNTGARLLLLTPNLHNPTTATLPAERREAIALLAERHQLTLIEDDVYGGLLADRPPPLARLLPERTVHVTSISKCVVPGLRLGAVLAPPALVEALANGVHALQIALSALPAELFRRWLETGLIERAMQRQRRELAERQILAAGLLEGLPLTWQTRPDAPHVWLHLPPPWRGAELTSALAARGLLVASGELFAVARGTAPAAIRLSLGAAADRAQLASALAILKAALAAGPPARPPVI